MRVIQSIIFGPLNKQKLVDIKKNSSQEIQDFLILSNGYIVIAYSEKVKNSVKSTLEIFSATGSSLLNYSM